MVFVTAYDQYALDAFERDAVDYLLKPVTDERLVRTIEKLRKGSSPTAELAPLLAQLSEHMAGRAWPRHLRWIRASKRAADGEITQQIPVADVLYFQADDKYTCVFARDGTDVAEWLIRVPLSDLGEQLNPEDFAQIHRSVIVNMNAVEGINAGIRRQAARQSPPYRAELPVARQYVHLFRQM